MKIVRCFILTTILLAFFIVFSISMNAAFNRDWVLSFAMMIPGGILAISPFIIFKEKEE